MASRFPTYTVHEVGSDDFKCGHQHQTKDRAVACARNNARRYRFRRFTVLKRLKPKSGEETGRKVATGFTVKRQEVTI